MRAHVDKFLTRAFGAKGPEREAAELAAKEAQRVVETLHRTAEQEEMHKGGLGAFAIEHAHAIHKCHGLSADESALPGGIAALDFAEIERLGKRDARATKARAGARTAQENERAEKLVAGGLAELASAAAKAARRDAASGDIAAIVGDGTLKVQA